MNARKSTICVDSGTFAQSAAAASVPVMMPEVIFSRVFSRSAATRSAMPRSLQPVLISRIRPEASRYRQYHVCDSQRSRAVPSASTRARSRRFLPRAGFHSAYQVSPRRNTFAPSGNARVVVFLNSISVTPSLCRVPVSVRARKTSQAFPLVQG